MNYHRYRPQYGVSEDDLYGESYGYSASNRAAIRTKRITTLNFPVASGNLTFVFTKDSFTAGMVLPYNDNILNVPLINIDSSYPVFTACRAILNSTGRKAGPYKLNLMQNNKLIYTIRSVLWGSRRTWDENMPDWLTIDHPSEQRFLG